MNEEIFIKDTGEPPKKTKRKLTEKQKENLAKGREKMKIKRELAKKNKEVKTEVKVNKESSKDAQKHTKIKRKAIKEKRKTMKEINKEKELAHLEKLQKQETTETNVSKYRAECLSKAKTTSEYREIESVLDGITGDILHNEDKLKEYCKVSMSKYTKKKEDTMKTIIEDKEI
tara:strand:- start:6919 stop:7437 length:519 start_codon:yes stop_codon:yes gene_type:complete